MVIDTARIGPGTFEPLGVTPDDDGSNVALWAEGATGVILCVFDDHGAEHQVRLPERTFNVFHGHIPDLVPGMRYGFRVEGPWDPATGARWNPARLLMDPYARRIDGDYRLGREPQGDDVRSDDDSAGFVPRSVVVDDWFDWQGDRHPRTPWGDTVIYEAHVRGLTMRHPGVPENLRGTYAGFAHPSVIDHFRNLGVTAVELMPVHHFIDEVHLLRDGLTNYWGYNTLGYFAPHARYAHGNPVTEFKELVRAYHAAGIEVILDVVYNHTCEGNEEGPTLCWRGIANREYYRLRNGGRLYADYTGCGNTLKLTSPHTLQLVMDSLRYWVQEMHVDGFRFDLASALARSMHDVDMLGTFMATVMQDPVLRTVKLIAEPWDVGPGGYQIGEFPPLWTEWNGRYRDCLRDFWRGATGIGELGWRLTGSADLYFSEGRRPYASINFITAHDGFTMHDLVTYEHKHNDANREGNRDGTDDNRSANYGHEGETDDPAVNRVRRRQVRNMLASLLLSTGVPMISGGDEIGRTQRGNNNAYCQDNEISWHDWEAADRGLLAFTASVMQLRMRHRVFRQRYFFDGRPEQPGELKDLTWFSPDGDELRPDEWNSADTRCLGMYLSGELRSHGPHGETLTDDSFLLLLNASEHDVAFTLPDGAYGSAYRRVIDTADDVPVEAAYDDAAGTVVGLTARSLMLLRVVG